MPFLCLPEVAAGTLPDLTVNRMVVKGNIACQ